MSKWVRSFGLFALAASGLCFLPGCDRHSAVVSAVKVAAQTGTMLGLGALANSNPAAAKTSAGVIVTSADGVLKYLTQGTLPVSTEVQAVLQTQLLAGLDPLVAEAIVAAAGVLDALLPVPGPDTYLGGKEKDYLVAFVQGVRDGASLYRDGKTLKDTQQRRWLGGK